MFWLGGRNKECKWMYRRNAHLSIVSNVQWKLEIRQGRGQGECTYSYLSVFRGLAVKNMLESAQSLSLKTRLGYWQINRLWVLPKNCFKSVPCYKISFRKGCTFALFQVSIGLVALSFFFLTPTIYFVEVILQLIPVKSLLGSETIVNSVAYPVQPFASGDCSSILIWV